MLGQLPNALTAVRLLLVPVIVWLLTAGGRPAFGAAFWLVMAAGATDGLDGWAARSLKAESRLGAYLDPIADKFLLVSLYLSLGYLGVIPQWLVWLVMGRDAVILAMAGAGFFFTAIRDFPPSVWGKSSTVFQILYALLLLAGAPGWLSSIAMWCVTGATLWSGIHYVARGVALLPHVRSKGGTPV